MNISRSEREVDYLRNRGSRLDLPSESRGSWQGVPGTADYRHITRVGEVRRMDKIIGPGGEALATKEFTWAQFSETVFDEFRKAEIERRIDERMNEINASGGGIDPMLEAEIRSEATKDVEDLLKNSKALNLFSNTLKTYQKRLEIVTSKIPAVFQNIEGVKDADGYLLVSGRRADNEREIFGNFESLNNAGGNAKLDRIFSHRGGMTEGHGDKDFFGWKVTVEGKEFVFIWNPNTKELDDQGKLDEDESNDDEAEEKAA